MQTKNWSSLKYWDCYNYGCSWYWSASTITEFSRTLRIDFDKSWSRKICERNSSSQLWHRELQFLVAHEGRTTSIMWASNLPSLPWNITSKVHKIRTTLKRRSNLHACIGKPLPPRCGKIPASSKSSSGGSGGRSNPMSIHPRTKSTYVKKEILRKERIWTTTSGWLTCRKHSFGTLIFKYVWFDTMMNVKREADGAILWNVIISALRSKVLN